MRALPWLCLLLAGCASIGTEPARVTTNLSSADVAQEFVLEGRVAVKSGEQNYSGGLRWERRPADEVVLLSTPLGQGLAEIRRDARGLTLTDAEGKRHEARDIDSLALQALGAPIPLSGLVYWISARPRPDAPHVAQLDAAGRVERLEQDGWRIDYDRYQTRVARELPARLFARRGEDIEFRLVVDAWVTP
jgi:outer membrane lipoprotein LolB